MLVAEAAQVQLRGAAAIDAADGAHQYAARDDGVSDTIATAAAGSLWQLDGRRLTSGRSAGRVRYVEAGAAG